MIPSRHWGDVLETGLHMDAVGPVGGPGYSGPLFGVSGGVRGCSARTHQSRTPRKGEAASTTACALPSCLAPNFCRAAMATAAQVDGVFYYVPRLVHGRGS